MTPWRTSRQESNDTMSLFLLNTIKDHGPISMRGGNLSCSGILMYFFQTKERELLSQALHVRQAFASTRWPTCTKYSRDSPYSEVLTSFEVDPVVDAETFSVPTAPLGTIEPFCRGRSFIRRLKPRPFVTPTCAELRSSCVSVQASICVKETWNANMTKPSSHSTVTACM